MPVLFHDFETKSTLDLREVGAWRYASDATTDAWCCAYAVDDGPIQLWIPGDPVPTEFIEAAQNPNWVTSAFGDHFERLITQHILVPRYGWPLVPIGSGAWPMRSICRYGLTATPVTATPPTCNGPCGRWKRPAQSP
jgi:DNA polymerase bacteriophage-type